MSLKDMDRNGFFDELPESACRETIAPSKKPFQGSPSPFLPCPCSMNPSFLPSRRGCVSHLYLEMPSPLLLGLGLSIHRRPKALFRFQQPLIVQEQPAGMTE
jgi:hypothetical protein